MSFREGSQSASQSSKGALNCQVATPWLMSTGMSGHTDVNMLQEGQVHRGTNDIRHVSEKEHMAPIVALVEGE